MTPHNSARPGAFAKTVLMPGDPLRSKYIADHFLENPVLVNNVRGVQGYTGTYKGVRVSVMASGMGMPSIGIYSYELYNAYNVRNIMRIGSAGAIQPEINLKDIVMAMGASMDSNYQQQFRLMGNFAPICSFEMLHAATQAAEELGAVYHVGNILSSDFFYDDDTRIELGNISIRTMLTPGHTIGCTSFFWEEKNPVTGDVYTVAMHGGVGANTMNDEYYSTSKYLTPDLRDRFFADADKVAGIHVDIALPSHPNQIEIMDKAGTYTHESQPYLDETVWADFVRERVRQVKVLM